MKSIEYWRYLDEENGLRVRIEVDRGCVLKFSIQLECLIDAQWSPVVRYDTAHGFAHCDRLHPYEPALKTRMPPQNYNHALQIAMDDLTRNWHVYRRRYQKWLKRQ